MGAAIFGAMLGPVIGGIASVTSTEATFGGVACLGLVLAACRSRDAVAPIPRGAESVSLLFGALRSSRMRASIWFIALPALAFGTLNVLGPLRLHELGLGAVAIGAVWLVGAGSRQRRRRSSGTSRTSTVARCRSPAACSARECSSHCFPSSTPSGGSSCPDHRVQLRARILLGAGDVDDVRRGRHARARLRIRFALINLAWAPGQIAGAAGGGALAEQTSDAVAYLVLAHCARLRL